MKKLFALYILFFICTTQETFTSKQDNEDKPQATFVTQENLHGALYDDDIHFIKAIFAVEKYWYKFKKLPTPFRSSLLQAPFDKKYPQHPATSPLEIATKGMDPEIVLLLINYGADVNYSKSILDAPINDICDIHAAYKHKTSHTILDILIKAKINVNQQDYEGETALHRLANSLQSNKQYTQHAELHYHNILHSKLLVVRKLLSAGANPYLRTHFGSTVFDTAKYVARTEKSSTFVTFLENETRQQPKLLHLKKEAHAQLTQEFHKKLLGNVHDEMRWKRNAYS
jgi:hypothetical protein